MKTFKKYIDAEKYAMEISAKELRCISIVHLFREGKSRNDLKDMKRDFTVMDTPNEWYFGIDYVMLISNFETPFQIFYTSPKAGSVSEMYPTKEQRDVRYKELLTWGKLYWFVYKKDLTPEQYLKECVEPYQNNKRISAEYRKTLIAK